MSKGLTINYSMVEKDGEYEIDFHYTDTDGVDVSHNVQGQDPEDMIYELAANVVEDMLTQQEKIEQAAQEKSDEEVEDDKYVEQLKKIIKDLTAENNSLKTDLDILQRRADDAVNKNMKKNPQKEKDIYNKYLKLYKEIDGNNPFRLYKFWF